ncbi:O-antigen ligase [Oceanicella sp. SM1341]|uniref:O-antigen ligase family protein n=1 Tax=Oceanicella sp. SM1341 TaxID=1548889 RepID=UPI000E4E9593|nr:O-antigen ligase family protein [Oceanicella sp. SM1341]
MTDTTQPGTAGRPGPAAGGLCLSWRGFEWWGGGLALFLLSEAVLPLLVMGPAGALSAQQMAQLRLVALPAYLVTAVLLWRHRRLFLWRALPGNLPLLLLMALPFVSVLWSISPSVSLRRAVGLLASMLLGYLLAMRFGPRQLLVLVGLVAGLCLAASLLLAALAPELGRMPAETALRGAFTHKNGLGRMACLGAMLAAALLLDPDRALRRGGLLLLGPALACLVLSQSATALLSAGMALGLAGVYALLARWRGLARILLVLVVVQVVAALLAWLSFSLVPFLEAIGKDATLTGRIPLWHELAPEILARFWTGYGYEAFWTPGNEALWRIWAAVGWAAPNAHSGWREVFLSFGLPGVALLALALLRGLRQGAALHCARPEEGWLWLNVLPGMVLSINLTESSLLIQNDLLWILLTAALTMFSLHRGSVRPPG